LADAERLTCLRVRHLSALEDERFDALPGHTYARAFLRSYASALGLQADLFVMEFDERFPELPEETVEITVPRARRYGELWASLPRKAILGCAVVVALIGAVAWSGSSGQASHPPLPAAPINMPHPRVTLAIPQRVTPLHPALVLTAGRGPCWLLVRRQSETGPVLYEGTLQPGESLSFRPRVWLRLGAPANVEAHRGASPLAGLAGAVPVDLVG
jgi:hypothetical protein